MDRVCFGLVVVGGRDQAELAVEQLVPFGRAVVAAFPGADHPDQGVVGGYRVAGGAAELACQLGHVPSARPAPLAQVAAADPGHRAYLSVAVASGSTVVLRGPPACSLLSLSHDNALPVDWVALLAREGQEASVMKWATGTGTGGGAALGGGR